MRPRRISTSTSAVIALLAAAFGPIAALATPTSVTVVGDLQSELGCPGDFQPDCAITHLTFDASDALWQGSFAIPAGGFSYKVAIDDNWSETHPAPNIPLALAEPATVKFFYDDTTHTVADDVNAVIATFVGNFQSELGCPGDWQPDCLRSWLKGPDGDGFYVLAITALPAGDYEGKVAIDESWDENYGAGGVPGGANYPFHIAASGDRVVFTYDALSHVVVIDAPEPGGSIAGFTAVACLLLRLRRSRSR